MTERPALTPALTLEEFASWYWLKTELTGLCRQLGVSSTGSKLQIEERLTFHFGGRVDSRKPLRRATGEMPDRFTVQTVIGQGWRCNPVLGAFLRQECGRGFRFNGAVRDFIHCDGVGKTLAEAVVCYRVSIQPGAPERPIPRQLEYNQHIREYFRTYPAASRSDAIAAWWEKLGTRHGTRPATERA